MGSFLQALGSLGQDVGDAGQVRKDNALKQGAAQNEKTRLGFEGQRVKNEDLRLLLERQKELDTEKSAELGRQKLKQDIAGYGWEHSIPVQQGDHYLQINTVTGERRDVPKEEYDVLAAKSKPKPKLQGWDLKQDKSGRWVHIPKDPTLGDKDTPSDTIGKLAAVNPNNLSSSAVKDIADAIEAGDQPPITTGLYRNAGPVRAELAKRGVPLAKMEQDWRATQKFLAGLNSTQQLRLRQNISTASDSLDKLEGLYKEWQSLGRSSGVKLFNRGALAAARNLPGRAGAVATALNAQIADLTSELGSVYMGGNSATDHALGLAAKNLSADWNQQTFEEGLKQARANIKIRNASIMNGKPAGAGDEYMPDSDGGQRGQGGGQSAAGGVPTGATHIVAGPDGKNHYTNANGTVDLGIAP